MEKVTRHDLLHPLDKEMDRSLRGDPMLARRCAGVGSICDIGNRLQQKNATDKGLRSVNPAGP
jgi:hypothetical protein